MISVYLLLDYLLPGNGTILPFTRAISCHCQAQNDMSGEKNATLVSKK